MSRSPLADPDFEARVAALRAEIFALLDGLGPALHDRRADLEITLAAVKLQSVANELGSVEGLTRRQQGRPAA